MFRRIGMTIAVTAPALVAAACDGEPGTPPEPPHRTWDSAGTTIVENPRPAPGSRLGWQIGAEPVLSIGSVGADDHFQLHRVDDALRLPDGRIVVANAGSHQLLVFDEAGEYLTAWGRKGDGPGEFAGEWGGNDLGWRLFWAEDHYSWFWLDQPPFKQTVVWAAWGPLTIVILGRMEDELGVEYVEMRELERTPSITAAGVHPPFPETAPPPRPDPASVPAPSPGSP